jgi:hypothetical protein
MAGVVGPPKRRLCGHPLAAIQENSTKVRGRWPVSLLIRLSEHLFSVGFSAL